MKTVIVSNSMAVKFDPEAMTVVKLQNDRDFIRNVFLIDEECDITFPSNNDAPNDQVVMHAKPNDILISFWKEDLPHPCILIKSDEWRENLLGYRKQLQEEKERWAQANKESSDTVGESL